ncbi:hypothetical protein P5V15_010034 [Pogonomyrmex californicus]
MCSRRPKIATTADNIENVHQMVLDDRRIKVREIAEAMGISKERVCHILTEELNWARAIRALGVALAHFGSKTNSNEHFQGPVGAV